MSQGVRASLVPIYILLFTLALINYLDRIALSVAAKPISVEFGLSPVEMGYLFSSFLWTYVLCLIPAGILTDRLGARHVAVGGMAVWSLATLFTGLVSSFGALLTTRLVMGAGEATTYPCANRFIRQHIPRERRGFATAVFNGGAYAGPAFGVPLIGWLVAAHGWRTAFVIAGAIGFVWLLPWMVITRGRHSSVPVAAASERAEAGNGLVALLRSPTLWAIAVTQGCAVYTQYLFLTWLPSHLQATKGLDIKAAAIYTALPFLCAVVLGLLLGRISDKSLRPGDLETGKRRRIVGIMLLISSVILAAPFVENIWLIVGMLAIALTGISTALSMNR